MKVFLLVISLNVLIYANVISCNDVVGVSIEAKSILHENAMKRAVNNIESLTGRELITPYIALGDSPEKLAGIIENFWCPYPSKPLHSAYFDFYSNYIVFYNKQLKTKHPALRGEKIIFKDEK